MSGVLLGNGPFVCYLSTGFCTRLMENNGSDFVGLFQLVTRDPTQCAVSAHGE